MAHQNKCKHIRPQNLIRATQLMLKIISSHSAERGINNSFRCHGKRAQQSLGAHISSTSFAAPRRAEPRQPAFTHATRAREWAFVTVKVVSPPHHLHATYWKENHADWYLQLLSRFKTACYRNISNFLFMLRAQLHRTVSFAKNLNAILLLFRSTSKNAWSFFSFQTGKKSFYNI